MAAGINDKFLKIGVAGTLTSLSAPGHSVAGTTITVASTTNWPTDTAVVFAIRQVDSSGVLVAGTYTEWRGVVSGSTLTAMVLMYGTDQVYPSGSTTQVYIPVSAARDNRLIDGLLVEHDQDGTHGAITASTIAASSTISGTVVTGTAVDGLKDYSVALSTYRANTIFDHVISGGVWTGDAYASTLAASMTAMVCMINGRRISVGAVTARAFTASKDVYIDVLDNADGTGTLVYTNNTINDPSPALAANSIRIGIIVTGASAIAAVAQINQGQETKIVPIASSIPYQVTDSLGNLICPRDPQRKILGYRQITASLTAQSTSLTDVDQTGLSVPVIVPTGRKVKISLVGSDYEQSGGIGTTYGAVKIKEGATVMKSAGISPATAAYPNAFNVVCVTTPSAGLHTYKAAVANNATGPTFAIGAAATDPCYIMVELV